VGGFGLIVAQREALPLGTRLPTCSLSAAETRPYLQHHLEPSRGLKEA